VTDATLHDLPAPLLANAERLLLAPADLDLEKISRVLASIHAHLILTTLLRMNHTLRLSDRCGGSFEGESLVPEVRQESEADVGLREFFAFE